MHGSPTARTVAKSVPKKSTLFPPCGSGPPCPTHPPTPHIVRPPLLHPTSPPIVRPPLHTSLHHPTPSPHFSVHKELIFLVHFLLHWELVALARLLRRAWSPGGRRQNKRVQATATLGRHRRNRGSGQNQTNSSVGDGDSTFPGGSHNCCCRSLGALCEVFGRFVGREGGEGGAGGENLKTSLGKGREGTSLWVSGVGSCASRTGQMIIKPCTSVFRHFLDLLRSAWILQNDVANMIDPEHPGIHHRDPKNTTGCGDCYGALPATEVGFSVLHVPGGPMHDGVGGTTSTRPWWPQNTILRTMHH